MKTTHKAFTPPYSIFTLILIAMLSLAACSEVEKSEDNNSSSDTDKPTVTEYTITFNSKGGSSVEAIKGVAGTEVTAPAKPTRDGFEFLGWFESTDGGETLAENAFVIGIIPARDVTLYAKWNEISEVGKKYAVKDYKTDVNFEFDNPESAPEDLDPYKLTYSTMTVSFKANNAVELFVQVEMEIDNTHFYAVNTENCVEFFETAEDAQNMTNKLTEDYFGFKYQFDSSKKTLTVTIRSDADGLAIIMVLSASE